MENKQLDAELSPSLAIISNVNGFSSPIKRQNLAEWIKT